MIISDLTNVPIHFCLTIKGIKLLSIITNISNGILILRYVMTLCFHTALLICLICSFCTSDILTSIKTDLPISIILYPNNRPTTLNTAFKCLQSDGRVFQGKKKHCHWHIYIHAGTSCIILSDLMVISMISTTKLKKNCNIGQPCLTP